MTWFFRWVNYDDLARCLDEMNVDVLQLWGYSPLWFVEDPAADGMEVGAWDVQSWIFWGTSLTGNPHFSCSKEPWHILSKTSTLLERWDSLSTSSGTTMWPSAMFGTGWRKWTKKPSRGVHWVHQFWGVLLEHFRVKWNINRGVRNQKFIFVSLSLDYISRKETILAGPSGPETWLGDVLWIVMNYHWSVNAS